MARTARARSNTGIYHVILRGINRQIIFEDEEDHLFFLNLLKKVKDLSGFELYAYCLMDNHVHLLIHTGERSEPLEVIFKRFEGRFVLWYNKKYARTGHLFQDRFLSEAVENEQYFRVVFRYIHHNPMKAGLESMPGRSYPWSSYPHYLKSEQRFAGPQGLIDASLPISVFGTQKNLTDFCDFGGAEDSCMDYEPLPRKKGPDDNTAIKILCGLSGCNDLNAFRSLKRPEAYRYVCLARSQGVTLSQLQRMTGFSRNTILKNCSAVKKD